MNPDPSPHPLVERLGWYFSRNGYVRWKDEETYAERGRRYHKGDEVRLVANTLAELAEIRRLLRAADFKPGRPFRKARQYRQPLYGRAAVARFLALIGERVGA